MTDLTVVTHNGNFHADDVFSIAVLKHVYPSFNLVRTRDKALMDSADIVIDVGGQYDPDAGRFDHHQRGGAGERENGIPYSSFGLVWQKYGLALCDNNQAVADRVDAGLVSTIDAIDCGHVEGVQQGISLSQTISMYNPTSEALYMVYPSHSSQWILQTVPVEPGSFEDRKSLPKAWAGLSDEDFQAKTGLDDAVFCHNGLFIAGTKSFESTMKLAEVALAE